jgi:hypothetical protein
MEVPEILKGVLVLMWVENTVGVGVNAALVWGAS